ncbi:MAG: YnbE family lipoprotein [Chlorobiaceae bacterium]|nr:YnbE family lipoprotein [Chlorobiaceae bacterium]
MNKATIRILFALTLTSSVWLSACSPTVKVEAPDKPIVINMNIKIDHEIRIKVDRELDNLLDTKKGLF